MDDRTARQIYEQAVRDAEKAVEPEGQGRDVLLTEIVIEDVDDSLTVKESVKNYRPEDYGCRSDHTSVTVLDGLADGPKRVKSRETAFDRRNFYRKQAGWPLLKEKING